MWGSAGTWTTYPRSESGCSRPTPATWRRRRSCWPAPWTPASRGRSPGRGRPGAAAPPGLGRAGGLGREDVRVIRLWEGLLHPGSFGADWPSREVYDRLLKRHRLTEEEYRLGQLRYDLGKLRAHGLVERIGTSRRYRLTPSGLKLGVLLVKLRTRLLGPLTSLASDAQPRRPTRNPTPVEAAFRQVDTALEHLCTALGLTLAA